MRHKKLIERYLPNIDIISIKEHTHWYDNDIIEVNGKYILRIRKANVYLQQQAEIEMLRSVWEYVSLSTPIPLPQSWSECLVYKKLEWGLLSQSMINSSEDKQLQVWAFQLSSFIYELHNKSLADSMQSIKLPKYSKAKEFLWYISKEENYKDQVHADYCKSLLGLHEKLVTPEVNNIFLHNDLYSNNIIIDSNTKNITWVIDFTDCTLWNPHEEFMFLFFEDIWFTKKIIELYNQKSSSIINESIVYLYAAIFAACEYKWSSENTEIAKYWVENWLMPK